MAQENQVRSLVKVGKVKGQIYDSSRMILNLAEQNEETPLLIDSVFNVLLHSPNKLGFFIKFNEASSNVRYGYAEIILDPYQTKFIFLNDKIDHIESKKEGMERVVTIVTCSSYPRAGVSTEYSIQIQSDLVENRLFTYDNLRIRYLAH